MILKPLAIYYCTYSNFHHDPCPNLFVLHSDGKYTEGINLHYLLPTRRWAFFNMIRKLAAVGADKGMVFHYNGEMMYNIIKKYYPDFAEVAYRKYFSMYLMGTLINDALNAASPLMTLYLKTQNMMSKSSQNYLEMKAKNEPYAKEVNKFLTNTRVDSMKNYEDMKFSVQKLPGPAAKPPDTEEPDKTKPGARKKSASPFAPET